MKELYRGFSEAITGELIEPEKLRDDVSHKLGQPLAPRERELFVCLLSNGAEPMEAKELYKEVTNSQFIPDKETVSGFVGSLVRRVRDKLGNEAIITKPGSGYLARNRLIREQVEKSKKEENKVR